MADRELLVRIIGDDRDLQRALGSTERKVASIDSRMQNFGRNIGRAFLAAGVAVGTAEIFRGLAAATSSAAALNEEISKSQQIFGSSANSIEAWSKTTAGAIGVAQVEALQATGTFGNLFSTVGLGQQDAAAMSQALVELAADLASFNNADPTDVLQALRSGLIGEAEPLRRYGVLLSETRVQQDALAASGKNNVKELTNQEKALARYNIILQDTQNAQGDFARTQDGAANQSRILRAKLNDLSTELGGKLLPSLVAVVGATNDLIDAFTQAGDSFEGIEGLGETIETLDISQIVALRDRLAEVKGEGDDVVEILDQIIIRLNEVQGVPLRPDDQAGPRGHGAIAASNARVDAEKELDAARKAKRQLEKLRREFDELSKGLGLKLDKAGLTASLDDDVSALRELERAILRQIQREGRTFKLVDQLTQVRLQIMSKTESRAADAADRAAQELEKRVERQERAAEKRRERIRERQQRRQREQFEGLGLTGGGEKKTPSTGALRRRLSNVREEIEGTILDTKQTEAQLDRIQKVLQGKFGKVGKNVREAILRMLNEISSAFDEGKKPGDKSGGPLTKTSGLNSKKILEGLGLSEEEIRALRGRLSGFNSAGLELAQGQATRATSRPGEGGFGNNPIVVQSTTTINLDGQQVAKVVTKNQQKGRRRNPPQKRGPNRNR
jgi:hypothetical protein